MRPKDTEHQKRVKKAMKQLMDDISSGKAVTMGVLARNDLLHKYIKYGYSPIKELVDSANDENTTGFDMIINSMFQKAISGDVRAIKMVLNMAGLDVDKVESSNDDKANTFQLKYNLGE